MHATRTLYLPLAVQYNTVARGHSKAPLRAIIELHRVVAVAVAVAVVVLVVVAGLQTNQE